MWIEWNKSPLEKYYCGIFLSLSLHFALLYFVFFQGCILSLWDKNNIFLWILSGFFNDYKVRWIKTRKLQDLYWIRKSQWFSGLSNCQESMWRCLASYHESTETWLWNILEFLALLSLIMKSEDMWYVTLCVSIHKSQWYVSWYTRITMAMNRNTLVFQMTEKLAIDC